MAQIPYCDSPGHFTVKVDLDYACDVFLVDRVNLQKYQSGQSFKYYGGHYNQTPVTISVNKPGRWYLIVVGGGQYKYTFY
ncbi:DUF1883 domain-containing protein [Clostridium perfringens]|nr:DUF1883 domain-containing protein [Clostridium perfringens]HBZ6546095.1 DUF1883 domain-containing protein [Clostridium perfringens]